MRKCSQAREKIQMKKLLTKHTVVEDREEDDLPPSLYNPGLSHRTKEPVFSAQLIQLLYWTQGIHTRSEAVNSRTTSSFTSTCPFRFD